MPHRTALLVAATTHRVTVDNSFGGQNPFARVEVYDAVGTLGDFGQVEFPRFSAPLTPREREAITAAFSIPVGFVSPDEPFDFAAKPTSPVARVSVGEPKFNGASATLTTGLVCGGTCGIGATERFVLEPNGTWTYDKTIGAIWIY